MSTQASVGVIWLMRADHDRAVAISEGGMPVPEWRRAKGRKVGAQGRDAFAGRHLKMKMEEGGGHFEAPGNTSGLN